MPSRRQRKLDALVTRLQVQYGPRAIHRDPLPRAPAPVPHISTTFPALDAALGIGGLPRGRISEISGRITSGKLTLAAKLLSAAQHEPDALGAWLDLGRTCDPDYLYRCGVDLERLLVVRPEDSADALAILLHLVESNTLAVLVFDSLSELHRGDESRLAGALERLATIVTQTQTAVIFLSDPAVQFRTLAHLATVRLELRLERWIDLRPDVRGYEGQVKIVKHKLGRAGGQVLVQIAFNGTVRGHNL